jgi:hypothetical protein
MKPETVSEKLKRGRPRLWDSDLDRAQLATAEPDARTRRGRQNALATMRGHQALREVWQPAFAWFWRATPTTSQEP